MTAVMPAARRYASHGGRRLGALAGGLVLTAVLSIAVPKLVVSELLGLREQPVLVAICLAILAIGVVLTIGRAFVTGPVLVETTPTEVVVSRGRRRDRWLRSEADFSSFVVRESTNGIRTRSERRLIVTTRSERVEIGCTWFTAATFSAMLADLNPVLPPPERAIAAAGRVPPVAAAPGREPGRSESTGRSARPERMSAAERFTLDRRPIRRALTVAATGIAIVVLLAAWLLVELAPARGGSFVLFVGAAAVVLIGVLLAPLLRWARLPRSLEVTTSSIDVDDERFAVHRLSGILLTPPGYVSGRRSIVLVDDSGARRRIPLGTSLPAGSRAEVFPDYERFANAVVAATADRPGLVAFELG